MLELRPNCECCDKDLPHNAEDALICSFECTFCRECAEQHLEFTCPNCGGTLLQRPSRPVQLLDANPASTKRVLKAHASCRKKD